MERTNRQAALRVTGNTLTANLILSAFKLFAGFFAHSAAMLSDAVHSLSDVAAEIIVMIGVKMANQQSDKEHPYGHERMECVAAIILSFILFSVGALIGWDGIQKIATERGDITVPGVLALAAAVVSIIVKEAMYHYTHAAARKINSVVLEASAWHHRSDAMSSLGSFAGILGARLGHPVFDPAASVVICFFIVKSAVGIFRDSIGRMTDKSCSDEVVEKIREVILSQNSVAGIDQIKTRIFGDKIYVDVEICADGDATLIGAHETAQRVHDAIEYGFPMVKHCMIHVNPTGLESGDK